MRLQPRPWIVLFVFAIIEAGCSSAPAPSPGASVRGSAGASAAASPSTSLARNGPSAPAGWVVTNLPFPDNATPCASADGGLQNLQVVSLGAGLIALGSCAHSASPSLVWVSPDGHAWQAVAPAALAHADVYQVLVADGLVIAVGQDVADGATAAAWTSRDGRSWTRSTGDLGCGVMSSVTRFGSQFIAFGNKSPAIPEFDAAPGNCEWVSADGVTWTAVSLSKTVFPDRTGVSSVSAGAAGLIAGGTDAGPVQSTAALWSSPDGRTWTRIDAPWAVGWFSIDAVLSRGSGFVLLGSDAHGNAVLPTSTDGVTWTPAPAPGQGTLPGGPTLGAGPAGFIFGGVAVNDAPSPTRVWTSSDGSSWVAAPNLPPESPPAADGLSYHSVAVVAGSFVVAASTADGNPVVVTLQP